MSTSNSLLAAVACIFVVVAALIFVVVAAQVKSRNVLKERDTAYGGNEVTLFLQVN